MARMGKLKPLRGTASNLANIVLENGEVAFDYLPENTYGDYGIKMGDGTTVYSELPYLIKRTKESSWTYDEGTNEAALLHNIEHCDQETIGKIYYIQAYYHNSSSQYTHANPVISQNMPYMVIGVNRDNTENTMDLMSLVVANYVEWHIYNTVWSFGKYTTSNMYSWLSSDCPNGYSADIQGCMQDMTERWREATGDSTGTLQSRQTKCKLLNPVEMFGYSAATYDPGWEYASSSDHKTDFANPTGDKYGSLYPIWTDSISALSNRRIFHDKAMSTTSSSWTNSYLAWNNGNFGGNYPTCFIVETNGLCSWRNVHNYALGVAPVIRLSNTPS